MNVSKMLLSTPVLKKPYYHGSVYFLHKIRTCIFVLLALTFLSCITLPELKLLKSVHRNSSQRASKQFYFSDIFFSPFESPKYLLVKLSRGPSSKRTKPEGSFSQNPKASGLIQSSFPWPATVRNGDPGICIAAQLDPYNDLHLRSASVEFKMTDTEKIRRLDIVLTRYKESYAEVRSTILSLNSIPSVKMADPLFFVVTKSANAEHQSLFQAIPEVDVVLRQANVGREAVAALVYLIRMYEFLPRHVIFLQANPNLMYSVVIPRLQMLYHQDTRIGVLALGNIYDACELKGPCGLGHMRGAAEIWRVFRGESAPEELEADPRLDFAREEEERGEGGGAGRGSDVSWGVLRSRKFVESEGYKESDEDVEHDAMRDKDRSGTKGKGCSGGAIKDILRTVHRQLASSLPYDARTTRRRSSSSSSSSSSLSPSSSTRWPPRPLAQSPRAMWTMQNGQFLVSRRRIRQNPIQRYRWALGFILGASGGDRASYTLPVEGGADGGGGDAITNTTITNTTITNTAFTKTTITDTTFTNTTSTIATTSTTITTTTTTTTTTPPPSNSIPDSWTAISNRIHGQDPKKNDVRNDRHNSDEVNKARLPTYRLKPLVSYDSIDERRKQRIKNSLLSFEGGDDYSAPSNLNPGPTYWDLEAFFSGSMPYYFDPGFRNESLTSCDNTLSLHVMERAWSYIFNCYQNPDVPRSRAGRRSDFAMEAQEVEGGDKGGGGGDMEGEEEGGGGDKEGRIRARKGARGEGEAEAEAERGKERDGEEDVEEGEDEKIIGTRTRKRHPFSPRRSLLPSAVSSSCNPLWWRSRSQLKDSCVLLSSYCLDPVTELIS